MSMGRRHFSVSQISKQLKDEDQKPLETEAEVKQQEPQT